MRYGFTSWVGVGFTAAFLGLGGFIFAADAPSTEGDAAKPAEAGKPQVAAVPAVPAAPADHPTAAGIEFFEKKIRPILVGKCYQCHATSAASVKGGLLVDTREGLLKGGESGAAIVPGDSASSLLMEALRFEGLEMPPTGQLSEEQIADFAKWIDMGAPDPRTKAAVARKGIDVAAARQFWAFQRPKKQAAPTVKDASWPATDIDRFVLAALEQHDLKPSADADKITWLRRVSFDLTGLPPSFDQVQAFVADNSPQAYEKVVDRLLASPQFGERWGRHWLDVARYGESTGKERNVPYLQAWRYRDWVIDSVNADKPFTDFITEQVAGDLMPAADNDDRNAKLIATGFLALGPKGLNDRNREQYLMDIADEQIDVVTRAFLATTVGCARCHDHKFDPIPTTDYYALAGIFRSTETLSGVKSRAEGANNDYTGTFMPLMDAPSATAEAKPAEKPAAELKLDPVAKLSKQDQAELKQLQERITDRREELSKLVAQAKAVKKDKKSQKKADDLKRQVKTLEQQIARLEAKVAELTGGAAGAGGANSNVAMGVRDSEKPADTQVRVRGEPEERGDVVPRGFLTVLKTPQTPAVNTGQSGRLELARWIAARENPLTARVAVNRIWYHLFGRGLVETIDNFGALGEEPSHPELLDYLAVRFMDNGWSTKQLIRDVVLSRAYRMSSDHDEAQYAKDPGNEYFWRMNRRRLDAESIRDALLAAAGVLDLKRPAGSPVAALGLVGEIRRNNSFDPNAAVMTPHRSVYLPLVRNGVPEALSVFDVADPSLVVGQRDVTTVATQALFLMNNPFVLEQARQTAEKLLVAAPSEPELRVEWAYRTILTRPATADERKRGARFVAEFEQASVGDEEIAATRREFRAWMALCQTLMASAEFRYLY